MTTDTLDLPTIDASALDQPAAPPASAPAIKVHGALEDIAKLDLTAVALAQYGDWRKDVEATKANLSTLVLDLSTPTKIKEARTLRQRLIGDPLAAVRKVAAGIKSKMAQTSKAVGAELEQIEAAYAGADKLILPQIEKREEELEQERLKKAKEEAERKAKHESGINRISAYVVKAGEPGMTAERIAIGIAQLEAIPTPTSETWEEFAVPAANAICETLEKMRALHAKALADEAAAAEAERVRRENERLAAELAEQKRKLAEQEALLHLQACEAAEARMAPVFARAATRAGHGRAMAVYHLFCDGAGAVPLDRVDGYIATLEALEAPADPNTPQEGANRDASAGQSHVAEGSASPAGRGADGPTACGAAPVSQSSSVHIGEGLYVGRRDPGPITMIEPAPAPADPDEKPTLKLGDLNDWLKRLSVSAAQLEALGFTAHVDRNARLYKPSDKARIRAALIEWLERLQ